MNLTFYIPEVLRVAAPSPDARSQQDLEAVHQSLIAAKIPKRIPEASPDLLAVILNEGKV